LPEKIFFTSVIRYDMDYSFLFTLFEGLDRQGPGSDSCTRRMSDILSLPEHAQILDIGYGGRQPNPDPCPPVYEVLYHCR
jgi:hypothetical protein